MSVKLELLLLLETFFLVVIFERLPLMLFSICVKSISMIRPSVAPLMSSVKSELTGTQSSVSKQCVCSYMKSVTRCRSCVPSSYRINLEKH